MPETEERLIRTALIGCGRISKFHVAALRPLAGVQLVAVCDLNPELARETAAEHGAAAFTDVETMMRESRPDVVHILTPPASHAALASTVAAHGAHLYIEKPLASTEVDARRIVEAARGAGVQVCPGHNRLFDPIFVEARKRVEAGDVGRVLSIRAEQGFAYEGAARGATIPWSYTYDWGIFDNLMTHALYVATHFLAAPESPQVVGFDLGRVQEAAVEELRVLIPSRAAAAEIVLSLNGRPPRDRLEIMGTRGRLLVDFTAMRLLHEGGSGLLGPLDRFISGPATAWQLTASTLRTVLGIATGRIPRYRSLRNLVGAFYDALRRGDPPPVSPEDGLLNVSQMEQIRRLCASAAKHREHRVTAAVQSDSSAPRILVTGATGFVGRRVVERLAAEGRPIRATTRLMSRVRFAPGVEWVQCDVTDDDDLRRALAGIDTVFHCAALAAGPGSLAEAERTNRDATVSLLGLAAESGVRTVVYLSSIGVYAPPARGRSAYVDETWPFDERAADRGVYTQSKASAERAVQDYVSHAGVPRVVILRPGTIYGPGASLPVGRLAFGSDASRPLVVGSRKVPVPLTHVDNVIDAMLAAAASEVPSGSVYDVVDDAELDQGTLATLLGEASGGRIRPLCLPRALVWTLMLGLDVLGLLRGGGLGTARYRLARTLADMRYRCEAARRELGWLPKVSLAEGLAHTLAASTEVPYPH